MNKLGWITSSVLMAITVQATLAQTSTTEEVIIMEPAFKSQKKPLIPGGKETRIPYSPVPLFKQRLTNSLEQIDTGVSKGWVTSEVAATLKQQGNEIAPLIDKIKDAKGADKPLVDEVEQKLTALNAAVFASFNKQTVKEEAKKAEPAKVESKKQTATTKKTTAQKKSAKTP